jgi:hypothetical protein
MLDIALAIAATIAATDPPTPADVAAARNAVHAALVEQGFVHADALLPHAYVCVGVEGAALGSEVRARLGDAARREIGGPKDCACVETESTHGCTGKSAATPACIVDVSDFLLRSPDEAVAQLTVHCGWPNDYGEVARFVRSGDTWQYLGAIQRIVF